MTYSLMRVLAAACIAAAAALAQTAAPAQAPAQPAPPAQAPAPAQPAPSAGGAQQQEPAAFLEKRERRFHFGLRARFIPLNLLRDGYVTAITDAPPIEWETRLDRRVPIAGFGVTAEYQITTSLGIAADLLLHTVRYEMLNNIRLGVRTPGTFVDTRQVVQIRERTRAQFVDLPVILRWRSTDEYGDPARWFLGAGPTVRQTRNVRTTNEQMQPRIDNPFNYNVAPFTEYVYGATFAAGITAKDDFGIRVTPEVRYTYWVGQSFSNFAARTNRHQLQFLIGLTF